MPQCWSVVTRGTQEKEPGRVSNAPGQLRDQDHPSQRGVNRKRETNVSTLHWCRMPQHHILNIIFIIMMIIIINIKNFTHEGALHYQPINPLAEDTKL